MVTLSQLRHAVGASEVSSDVSWPADETPLDQSPARFSSPARITIASVIGLALVGLAIASLGVMWKSTGETETFTVAHVSDTPDMLDPAPAVTRVPDTVIVHVVGNVMWPGIVELTSGSRVVDAIEAAGGVTESADLEGLNLARIIIDGEQVYVPAYGEDVTSRVSPHSGKTGGPVSLSLADQSTLETLPGVGPSLAARIIAFRDANGPFESVSDVLAVSGIGPSTLDGFADLVIP